MPVSKIQPKVFIKQKRVSSKDRFFQSASGTYDVLPHDHGLWKQMWQVGQSVSELHNFYFIDPGLVELSSVIDSALPDSSALELFSFTTPRAQEVVLRPDMTVSVMRTYFQHRLAHFSLPLRVFYYGSVFRSHASLSGEQGIQSRQWGYEIVGDSYPLADVQVILVLFDFLRSLKLKGLTLKVNVLGCRSCANSYRQKLRDYYQMKKKALCDSCVQRYEKSPSRLFECSQGECRKLRDEAPIILDYLCQNCNNYFKLILELIEDNGFEYEPNPYLTGGMSYYSKGVFEILHPSIPYSIASGGRYDYLGETLGGRVVPSVGGALFLDKVLEAMRLQRVDGIVPRQRSRVFFAAVGEEARKASLKLMSQLRTGGIPVVEALGKKSLHLQLKAAQKMNIPIALVLGQREVFEGTVILKDMISGVQEYLVIDKLVEGVRKRLR